MIRDAPFNLIREAVKVGLSREGWERNGVERGGR